MAKLSRDRGLRPDTILIGQLGRTVPNWTGPNWTGPNWTGACRTEAAAPAGQPDQGSDARQPLAALAEGQDWSETYGKDWVASLQDLAGWAKEVGIPIRAGSHAVASSEMGQWWGWGGLPESIRSSQRAEDSSRPTWVLRVPPGWSECVRARLDSDSRLAPRGLAPVLIVEECPLAHLPSEPSVNRWPSPEAWWRAERLMGIAGEQPLDPRTPEELVQRLQSGAMGRHPLEMNRARLTAWDLWCAASAWEGDRAAWWMVRSAAGFASSAEELSWSERAADWSLRLLPASLEKSGLCAKAEAGAVRLGLEGFSAKVREIAPVLVQDRARGGAYHTAWEFVRRSRRRGAEWSVIAEFALVGALDGLREPPLESGRRWLATVARQWWSGRRAHRAWVQQH